MTAALEALKSKMAVISGLRYAGALMGWDQETYMPEGSTAGRARAMSTISRLAHEHATSPEYGRLLEDASHEVADMPPDSDESRLIWQARREYDRAIKLPSDLVAEMREAEVTATQVWQACRPENDWQRFTPYLERILEQQRKMADLLGWEEHPYDALLDIYEPEMRTSEVRRVFNDLRERTAPLVSAIADRADEVDDSFLHQHYDEDAQWALSLDLMERFGYDYTRGRMDRSAHPFTTTFAQDDVRVTTRVDPEFFNTCFFAAAHECGHALYNQGLPERFANTPLQGGASSGMHESQSRLWENVVGRSLPFLSAYYPRIQEAFPDQLGGVDLEQFYRAVNRSAPSLIRVEADEVTYNLHIMLRFDLEVAMFEGELGVEQLPARWNEKMEQYLGVTPDTDADGVMQDIHWPSGLYGYFPTYTLGNVISLQLYEAALRNLSDLQKQLENGNTAPLLGWMREHVHAYGRKFPPQDLLERTTGQRLSAEPYLNYLNTKFGAIYSL